MTDSRTVSVTTASAPPDAIDPIVTDVSDRRRFEIEVDGAVAGFAEYRRRPGVILFTHTEIDAARNGEGLGTKLVRAALDSARAEGLAVLPYCPFVRDFIKRHPEYLNLVPEQRREQFALTAAEVPSRSQFRHPVTVPPIPSKTTSERYHHGRFQAGQLRPEEGRQVRADHEGQAAATAAAWRQ